MAIQRRTNALSQERIDLSTWRAVESAVSNDFDQTVQAIITGTTQGYFLRGFNIEIASAIGGPANGLQLSVDPGAILHINASQSGTIYMVPTGTPNQTLNSATNTIVTGAFTPNAINYIGLDYARNPDPTTDAQSYFWDPTSNSETTMIVPQAIIMTYTVNISTTSWPSNLLPIATVTTDAGNNVISITDARWLLFRLGTGGASPNPFYVYPWIDGRTENPSTSTSDGVDPFYGGDKQLQSLKDWMNAIMSALEEIKGTTYWYSSLTAYGSIALLREDIASTVVTGNTTVSHGILPNSTPVLTTSGNTSSGSNQLTALASTTGIVAGQLIIASGLPSGTTVLSIIGSTVTMSAESLTTITGVSVSFYSPAVVTSPGQINWASTPAGDGQIYFKLIGSRLSYQIAENPTGSSVLLADNQVAYINLTRNVLILPNLFFVANSVPNTTTVTSIGAVSWTTGLMAGDWIRAAADSDANYYEIKSVDSPSQVTLYGQYVPANQAANGELAVYAYGVYTLPGQTSTSRDMVIAYRYAVPTNANVAWMFLRSDDGGSVARVYVKFLGYELQNGESIELSGPQLDNVLQYIGSPIESATAPNYTSALYPGAVPEVTQITVGSAATMSSNQYFYIYSSGNYRDYYVWANINGTGVDPKPLADYIGIPWIITSGQTATQVAADLVTALNNNLPKDFSASSTGAVVTVTNTSAGATNPAINVNVPAPFAILVTQTGTGVGNYAITDGQNLTLAIKELDQALGAFALSLDSPTYDESITIVASGGSTPPYAPPVSINGPISPGTNITLPENSRLGDVQAYYTVGRGTLEVYLNGQYLLLGTDWAEVGATGSASAQIQTLQTLDVGDELQFRIGAGGGGGGGGGGGQGPAGPAGPQGPPGANAAGGPVAISTKTGPTTYTVLLTDCFLRADCTAGAVTFNLPDATSGGAIGRIFYIKKVDASANIMTLQAFGSQLIDGSNTQSSSVQYESFSIISNGISWDIF